MNTVSLRCPQTSFKSAYPVVHWVAESNGSYAPISNLQLVKKLQGKIVRVLNKPLISSEKPMMPSQQRLRTYIGFCDVDYRNKPVVRSFYNRVEGTPDSFSPVSYIISGKDVSVFNDSLAKNIGLAKSMSMESSGHKYSEQTLEAIKKYNQQGLNFVKELSRQICDKNNLTYILHTKFEIVRNKLGKIKDYRFVDARFLPVNGSRNPIANM